MVDPFEIASAKIDFTSLHHALLVGVSRPGPACERPNVSSRDFGDQPWRLGPEQIARSKSSTCVQDRLRFSEALSTSDNSHRTRPVVIHRLPHHKRGVG